MKRLKITVATLVTLAIISVQAQAQTSTSEGNAANSAQSNTSSSQESTTDAKKKQTTVTRTVTGSRPAVNSTSDRFKGNAQKNRENRASSDADGKVDKAQVRPKADAKTKQKRSKGRSFGNTGPEN